MSKKFRTHYDNLGVTRTADIAVIKAAYKALAKKYHPDINPDNPNAQKIMQIINKAYEVLSDPIKRAEHDKWIDEQEKKDHTADFQNQGFDNHQQSSKSHHSFYDYTSSHTSQENQWQDQNNSAYYNYTNNTQHQSNGGFSQKSTKMTGKPSFWSFGRMRRTTYALLSIPTLFVWIIIRAGMQGAVSSMNDYDVATLFFMTVIELIPIYFLLFIGVKRLHDCDHKGWWILIPFFICVIWFARSTQGTNRFGTDPRDGYADDEVAREEDYSFWGMIVISIIINIAMISNVLEMQKSQQQSEGQNTTQNYTPTQANISHQNTPVTNTQTATQTPDLATAKRLYNNAVINMNAVWNSLHPSTQEFLRAEQRAINSKRERDCTAYGNAQSTDKDLAMAYRYMCEVPQLNERAEHLKTQLNTAVTPPMPKNVGPAYGQNHQTKDELVLSQMMKIYNNPQLAPPVYLCQGDIYCNAFSALSQYWIYIPDDYRYQGEFNIKYQAQIGDGYGLNKGFTLSQEQSILLAERGDLAYYNSGGKSPEQEKIFAEGLAVLLYIEEMNGWL